MKKVKDIRPKRDRIAGIIAELQKIEHSLNHSTEGCKAGEILKEDAELSDDFENIVREIRMDYASKLAEIDKLIDEAVLEE